MKELQAKCQVSYCYCYAIQISLDPDYVTVKKCVAKHTLTGEEVEGVKRRLVWLWRLFEVEGCGIFSWSSDVNRLRQRCTVESQGGEKYA
jgi:hypothetical protein